MTREAKEMLEYLIWKMEEDATRDELDDMIPDAMADAEPEVIQELGDELVTQYGYEPK